MIEGSNDHDRSRVRAVLADDVVVHDRRRTGMGLLEGADAYVESLDALWELAPDMQLDPCFQLALAGYGLVSVVRGFGTLRDGGAFERPLLSVVLVSSGRITRIEFFEIDDVNAGVDALRGAAPRSAAHPAERGDAGAAIACGGRSRRGTWDALRCAVRADDDRSTTAAALLRSPAIASMFIASSRVHLAHGAERRAPCSPPRATGWRSITSSGRTPTTVRPSEVETPSISRRSTPRAASSRESPSTPTIAAPPAWRCSSATPAATPRGGSRRRSSRFSRALTGHDLDRLRAVVPRDFVFDDHRRTGLGRLESAEDYLAAVAVLFEQSPDVLIEGLYVIAEERHGSLGVTHRFGTLAEGGTFESVFVQIALYRGDQLAGLELFEPEHLDVARARFEALRTGPHAIRPTPRRAPAIATERPSRSRATGKRSARSRAPTSGSTIAGSVRS